MKLVAYLTALLLTACGGGGSSIPPVPPAPADARVYQVAAYGDSTQFELGDPHPAGAPGMWVKNAAYGGASAASMLAGYLDKGLPWAQEMARQKAPVVVFNPGINDHPYTVEQYRENLRALVTIAQAAGKFVILEEPNPAGEVETPLMASIRFDVAAFEARRLAMRDLATHMGVYFCAQPRVSLRDGIHPDEAGYAVKVQRLHACLLDAV